MNIDPCLMAQIEALGPDSHDGFSPADVVAALDRDRPRFLHPAVMIAETLKDEGGGANVGSVEIGPWRGEFACASGPNGAPAFRIVCLWPLSPEQLQEAAEALGERGWYCRAGVLTGAAVFVVSRLDLPPVEVPASIVADSPPPVEPPIAASDPGDEQPDEPARDPVRRTLPLDVAFAAGLIVALVSIAIGYAWHRAQIVEHPGAFRDLLTAEAPRG